jgi:hypothetical protein
MNELIQEFAEQADLFADSKLQMKGEYHPDWHDIRDKKFAELIIQECENYILSEVERLVKYQNSLTEIELRQKNDVEICIEKCYDNILGIRQHFGIE